MALAQNGQRLAAIKVLRAETGCGLAEGKAAVDHIVDPVGCSGPSVTPPIHLKSITLELPAGPVTVDLEGLQLLGLMSMGTLGLGECRSILELVDLIQQWQSPPPPNRSIDPVQAP